LVTKVAMILALAGALAGPALAGEPPIESCAHWNTFDRTAKMAFVLGWARGIKAAAILSDSLIQHAAGKEVSFKLEPIIEKTLWPSGRELEAVRIEIDTECKKPENQKEAIMITIVNLASKINGGK
jgi:hypothetical protein